MPQVAIEFRPLSEFLGPVLTTNQIQLGYQLSKNTLSPLGITLLAMVPAGLSMQADLEYQLSDRSLGILETDQPLLADPSPTQARIVGLLMERGPLRGRQLDRAFPHQNWRKSAGSLVRR